jgi:hypothetical protein
VKTLNLTYEVAVSVYSVSGRQTTPPPAVTAGQVATKRNLISFVYVQTKYGTANKSSIEKELGIFKDLIFIENFC